MQNKSPLHPQKDFAVGAVIVRNQGFNLKIQAWESLKGLRNSGSHQHLRYKWREIWLFLARQKEKQKWWISKRHCDASAG